MKTKKHFIARAKEIAAITDHFERHSEAQKAADAFADSNPQFNRKRFCAACNVRDSVWPGRSKPADVWLDVQPVPSC